MVENFIDKIVRILKKENFDGIVFAHRFRGEMEDHHERYQVEVLSPYTIAEIFCGINSKKDRRLLFFTSPAAEFILDDQPFGYHASKAAVNQLVKYLSVKFGSTGVITNGIAPGSYIYKERAKDFWTENHDYLEKVKNIIPVGRLGSIEDIVKLTKFLLKDSSIFMNGVIIKSDGGLSSLESSTLIRSQFNINSQSNRSCMKKFS
jgi:NAD(P)-dependent dehydrogenase (short-subunit alcohol dehydrogenase family)